MVLITVATAPVFGRTVSGEKCQDKEGCVGHTEKFLFITGMALIGIGRAARVATAEPFIEDQIQTTGHDQHLHNNAEQTTNHEEGPPNNIEQTTNHEGDAEDPPNSSEQTSDHEEDETDNRPLLNWWRTTCVLVFFCTPLVVIFAFPYIKKWYILFGLSATCTILATIFFWMGACTYKKPKPKAERSPVTDFARVIVAAALKINKPIPKDDEEFQSLSHTNCILGFLHKAAIKMPGDRIGSWKLCSVSEVESAKAIIRLVPILSFFIMPGVVSSIGNTYFIEQASYMKFNIGKWKPPLQLLHLISACGKCMMVLLVEVYTIMYGKVGAVQSGFGFTFYSVVCCAVAAAVERRRIRLLRRHDLLDLPDDGKVPMSAAWLFFQIGFAGMMEPFSEIGFSDLFEIRAPKSMKRYRDCYVEGVTGLGFLCTALSVYVVGNISEAGGGKNWFQATLNRSRLDRYYWVLTALCSLNLIAYVFLFWRSLENMVGQIKFVRRVENDVGLLNIKKGGAVELVLRHYKLSPSINLFKNRIQFLEYVLS